MEHDLHFLAFFEEILAINEVLRNSNLLEGFSIHKNVAILLFVEILVSPGFDAGCIYFYACIEGIVNYFAGGKAFELCSNERRAFSRFYVLEVNNSKEIVIKFEAQSHFKICCRSHKRSYELFKLEVWK